MQLRDAVNGPDREPISVHLDGWVIWLCLAEWQSEAPVQDDNACLQIELCGVSMEVCCRKRRVIEWTIGHALIEAFRSVMESVANCTKAAVDMMSKRLELPCWSCGVSLHVPSVERSASAAGRAADLPLQPVVSPPLRHEHPFRDCTCCRVSGDSRGSFHLPCSKPWRDRREVRRPRWSPDSPRTSST